MKIRRRKYRSGRVGWQLDYGLVGGKRKQVAFETKAAAEVAAAAEKERLETHGTMADGIGAEEMAELLHARRRLLAAGGGLVDAVEFWVKHAARQRAQAKVIDLVAMYREEKKEKGRSARYVSQLGVALGTFTRLFPLALAHEVTRQDVEEWLRVNGWAAKTHNNRLGDLRSFFAWAIGRGFARINPVDGIGKRRLIEGEIVTLNVEECHALVWAADRCPQVLGYVVLGLFGGIRPAEIERMEWGAVNLKTGEVVVGASHAKTRRRRVVDLSENARAWLHRVPVELREGRICGRGFLDAWRVLRRELGWDVGRGASHVAPVAAPLTRGRWPHDAMRHTFASMHYAAHQNEAALQVQMGHESARMLHQHYRAVKSRAEALAFWALFPPPYAAASCHEACAVAHLPVRFARTLGPARSAARCHCA